MDRRCHVLASIGNQRYHHFYLTGLKKPKVFVAERKRVRKLFFSLIPVKEPCVRKFEGLTRSKILGILQTEMGIYTSVKHEVIAKKNFEKYWALQTVERPKPIFVESYGLTIHTATLYAI